VKTLKLRQSESTWLRFA